MTKVFLVMIINKYQKKFNLLKNWSKLQLKINKLFAWYLLNKIQEKALIKEKKKLQEFFFSKINYHNNLINLKKKIKSILKMNTAIGKIFYKT